MIRDVPPREWCSFLERFGREHVAWLATVHVVDARGTVRRTAAIALKSASGSAAAVTLEFVHDAYSLHVGRPIALRIQQTDVGLIQALEIETADGEFARLAFRATAKPEQLDGVAPGELIGVPLSANGGATAAPATDSSVPHEV
jgi:hypothetical protein